MTCLTDAASLKKQALLLEEVQKLNVQNAERSLSPDSTGSESEAPHSPNLLDFILEQREVPADKPEDTSDGARQSGVGLNREEEQKEEQEGVEATQEEVERAAEEEKKEGNEEAEEENKEGTEHEEEENKEEAVTAAGDVRTEEEATLQRYVNYRNYI